MRPPKIEKIAALFAAGDTAFLAEFKAMRGQFSETEMWALIHSITEDLEASVVRAESSFLKATAA